MVLALCLLLTAAPSLAEGVSFTLHASVDPAQYSSALQPLVSGLDGLLDVSALEGTLAISGGSFALDASLLMGDGAQQSRTDFEVYGLDSHWGVRSSLLGDEELMVNLSSLLPFGQKASDWLGLPLDKAALLVPFTHVSALQNAWEVAAPLFPAEVSKRGFTRAELDEMARTLLTLCDEDPALNRWLETTGLYRTVTRYLSRFLDLPVLVVPGMTVNRTETALTWDVYFVNVLSITQADERLDLSVSIPTLVSVTGALSCDNGMLTGSFHAQIDDSIQADAAFLLPASFPMPRSDLYLTVSAKAPQLPGDGYRLSLTGEADGSTLTIHQDDPDHGGEMLTVTASLADFTPDTLPAYTPADLTGMNILSVNGDSLQELMHAIRRPLLTGALDLIVAAPPEAVQAIMDYAEDSGLLDLLADALSGGTGY